MASAEGGLVQSGIGMGYREECSLPSRQRSLGECRELPSGSGAQLRPKTDFGVLKATESSFLYLYDKI